MKKGQIIFRNIKLPYDAPEGVALEKAYKKAQSADLDVKLADARIYKKSIDARNKQDILFEWPKCS